MAQISMQGDIVETGASCQDRKLTNKVSQIRLKSKIQMHKCLVVFFF